MPRTPTLLLFLLMALTLTFAACSSEINEGETGQLTVKTEEGTVTDEQIIHFGAVRFGDNPSRKIFLLENDADKGDVSVTSVRLITNSPSISLTHGAFPCTPDATGCVIDGFVLGPLNTEQFDLAYAPQSIDHDCGTPPAGESPEYCGRVEIESSDGAHMLTVLKLHVASPSGQLQVCLDTGECGISLNIAFANALVGDVAQTRGFTFENVGGGFLQVQDVNQILTPAAEFTLTGQAPPIALAPGQQVGYDLTFAPQTDGVDRSGTIVVTSNASANPTATISVSVGDTNTPKIEVFPERLDFPNVNQGETVAKSISISNVGGTTAGALTVDFRLDPSDTPDYTVTDTTSGDPLAGPPCAVASPPGSCRNPFVVANSSAKEVTVTYTPTTANGSDATLRISSNDPTSPNILVPLHGTSGTAFLTVTPAAVSFVSPALDTPVSETLTLTNEGTAALTITGVTKRNFSPVAGESLFVLSADPATTPIPLEPNASTTIDVTFTRDAADTIGQAYTGEFAFLHDGVSGETIVSVSVSYP